MLNTIKVNSLGTTTISVSSDDVEELSGKTFAVEMSNDIIMHIARQLSEEFLRPTTQEENQNGVSNVHY